MQAFHNDPAVKAKYVNRIAAHIAADDLIHGVGWQDGKGCAVGCTFDVYEHARGPVELGLPEWLMRLEDRVYEGLQGDESRDFVAKFLAVIPVGADVEPVRHKLAIRRIDRLLTMQRAALNKTEGDVKAAIVETIAAIEMVRRCHDAEISGNSCDWSAAAKAAWSASATASALGTAASEWSMAASAWSAEAAAVSAGWLATAAASAARSGVGGVGGGGGGVGGVGGGGVETGSSRSARTSGGSESS